jgi:hypothetical protein
MTPTAAENTSPAGPVGSIDEAQIVIAHLIDVMDAMIDMIEDETKLVRAGMISTAAKLVPSKNQLSQLYFADTQRLKDSQSFLARTAPNALTTLHKRHGLFQAVVQMNLRVLTTAQAVSEGIIRGVSDELTRKSMPTIYGASGRSAAPHPRHAQPLALSRAI